MVGMYTVHFKEYNLVRLDLCFRGLPVYMYNSYYELIYMLNFFYYS